MANVPPSPDKDTGPDGSPVPSPTSYGPRLHRSLSNSSRWSSTETPQHHLQGTSYFTRASSPPPRVSAAPILLRSASATRRGHRSTSVSSSHAAGRGHLDGTLSEQDEGTDDNDDGDEDDVQGKRRDRGKSVPVEHTRVDDDFDSDREEDPITLKDRQSLINVEHPFGLPIWKPALYKKSRSVTRHADEALHSVPSAQAERHLLPGNIFWAILFGWWLALVCFVTSFLIYSVPMGGARYSSLLFGLGWYLAWPFGKYVEGDLGLPPAGEDEERPRDSEAGRWSEASDVNTVRGVPADVHNDVQGGVPLSEHATITPGTYQAQHAQTLSWNPVLPHSEMTSLVASTIPAAPTPAKSYGATSRPTSESSSSFGASKETNASDWLGRACYWLIFSCVIAPLMSLVCLACWALVVTIPMAKLNWELITYLYEHPMSIRFCAAPPAVVVASPPTGAQFPEQSVDSAPQVLAVKYPRLAAGQATPSSPTSTVLLCTYRAVGLQYYKYTVGGVNIMFVNLVPVVVFTIIDGLFLLPMVDSRKHNGEDVPLFLELLASRALIFIMSLASVIPLSYFIGMAVASISAQSSIGMGAVINATFGSVIEIILYAIALRQGKGHLVEGSIVGSLLAGVLLMPGMSMCSSALRRKEQKFNAKSAGVTSMMLIMAIIGTLTPTLFYQTYGNFQLICSGCPQTPLEGSKAPWVCEHCYYQHPDPVGDPFYQSTVKSLMYLCAGVLLFSYLIGLWFSLRTHASQIWQNPQQLLHPSELPSATGQQRHPLYHRLVHGSANLNRKSSGVTNLESNSSSRSQTPVPRVRETFHGGTPSQKQAPYGTANQGPPVSPSNVRRVSYASHVPQHAGYTPLLETVDQAVSSAGLQPMHLPEHMTTDEFTRAVAVATVSALRQQQTRPDSPLRVRASGITTVGESEGGGHDAPSWSRTTSASVLLVCTALYAAIAEILVEVVDVVLEGSGIDEKFLGITLFALVPNTTEFMNAMSFALNGNIALSMEIGSAYALQVCLLQIPAMVAFSAWYAPEKMGVVSDTFTLIFPRWDVLCIILAVFLMTYTYIEAKSNYHRGSILILSYLVLVAGFYFAPQAETDDPEADRISMLAPASLPFWLSVKMFLSRLLS